MDDFVIKLKEGCDDCPVNIPDVDWGDEMWAGASCNVLKQKIENFNPDSPKDNFDDKINYHSIKILPNCPLTKNQKITIEGPEINYEI